MVGLPIKVIIFCNRSNVNDVIRIVYGFKSSEIIFEWFVEGESYQAGLIRFFKQNSFLMETIFMPMSHNVIK